MLEIVSEAVKSMSEELLSYRRPEKLNIKEGRLFKIIISKTAALLSACTACGARSVTEDADTIQLMKDFGENIGIAFQIRDDLLDYEGTGLTGKTVGNDIKEKNYIASHICSGTSCQSQKKTYPRYCQKQEENKVRNN